MYFRRIAMMILCLIMTFGFTANAYAAPVDGNTFFSTFKIRQGQIAGFAENGDYGLYAVTADGVSVPQSNAGPINDYKVLVLNNGYSKLSVVTFSPTKLISGKGQEQTVVGVNVFHTSGAQITDSNASLKTIGASGVYNSQIGLDTGNNCVVIAVKKGSLILYRLFKITVMEEQTKGALENMKLFFVQTDKSNDEPAQGSLLKQVIGTPVIDSLMK